eukprot:CAMPEP_0197586588 /NCGR_PEP_ID=MMETSP1326-20131121/8505_1 /TAXON_ID=1155430 /ORGANISM="Genus nov. species nov., Strain RCC2288" /LENGTH=46 /DNA_ID= /DNA_START= /DNA_END= /DNA_ORIENTATION=
MSRPDNIPTNLMGEDALEPLASGGVGLELTPHLLHPAQGVSGGHLR